jgi:ornithine cyclodeaminase/alanine dehydrogenase-like protein (mu-crystallin family)
VPGRRTGDEITLADLTGVGVQDVAAAGVVLARARAAGAGERIRL